MLLFSNILLLVNAVTSRRKIKIFNIRVSSVIWLHYPLYSRSIWGYINEYGWLFHSIGGTLGYFYRTLGAKWVCYQPVVFTGIIHGFTLLTLYLFYTFNIPLDEHLLVYLIIPVKLYSNAMDDRSAIIAENKGKSGVYRWTNLTTGSIYIGSSIDLGRRFREYYRYDLLANKRANSIIHRALLKYGYSFFSVEVLEYCNKEETFTREQFYLDLLKPAYNIYKSAGVYAGYKHSDEIRREMSESRRGVNNSFYGKKHTDEAKLAIRTAALNRDKYPVPGIIVDITDLETNITTSYDSIRKAAKDIGSDLKTILRREKSQLEKGINTPYRNRYIIVIHRS
jgi:group I intron endonuclease